MEFRRVLFRSFLSPDPPSHSLRISHHVGKTWLIAVGGSFKPGQVTDTEVEYRKLAEFVRANFEIGPIGYRWMNQDYNPMDQLPYIGDRKSTRLNSSH